MAKLLSGRIKHSTLDTHIKLEETEPFLGLPESDFAISLSTTDGTRSFFNFDNSFVIDSATGVISVSGGGLGDSAGSRHDSDLTQQQIDSTLQNSPDLGGLAHDSTRTQAQIDSSINELVLHDSELVQRQIDSSVTFSSIGNLIDVNLVGLSHNKILKYDSDNQEFVVATDVAESSGAGGGDSGLTLNAISVVDQGGFGFLEYSGVSGIFTFQGTDSADVTTLIDSAYIESKISQAFIDTLDTHDSDRVNRQIDSHVDSAFLIERFTPNLIENLNLLDSASVSRMIDSQVDSAFIRPLARAALQAGTNVVYDSATGLISVPSITPEGVDSAPTLALIDSDHVRPLARAALQAGTNIIYDSATGTINATQLSGIDSNATRNFIDSAYVQSRANQLYINSLDTHDSALVSEQIVQEVDSDFLKVYVRSLLTAGLFINYDSATGTISATTAVDSALTLALLDSDYIQARITQEFIDTFDTHDSATVQEQIDSNISALLLHDSALTQKQIDSNFNDAAVFLRSDQADFAQGTITFENSVELRFGEGTPHDFVVYHNATENRNYIQTGETDSIAIAANTILFLDKDSGATIFKAFEGGATELYYNRQKKAETTDSGLKALQILVESDLTVQGIASFDAANILGDRILTTADAGSGNGLDADRVDGLHASAFIRKDSADIVTQNTNWNNGAALHLGDGGSTGYDLRIYHNISDDTNYIQTGEQDNLTIAAETITLSGKTPSDVSMIVNASGSTDLYYNKIPVAYTTSNGFRTAHMVIDSSATLDGYRILTTNDEGSGNNLDADTLDSVQASQFLRSDQKDQKTAGALVMNDGVPIKLGTDSDHTITEASGNMLIRSAVGSVLQVDTEDLQVKNQSGSQNMIRAQEGGQVDLFYNNSSKIQTTDYGVNIDTKVIVDSADVTANLQVKQMTLNPNSQNVGSSITTVDTTSISLGAMSVDYTIHAKDLNGVTTKGEVAIAKVLAVYDSDGAVGFTEFGTVFSGDSDFGDFSVDVDAGNLRLRFQRRAGRNGAIQIKPFKQITR